MKINYTIQGLLIYLTMTAYLLALLSTLLKYRKISDSLYVLGFAIAVCSFAYRWYHVQHVPMQNLFEVFLCLGLLIYPVSLFCNRTLGLTDRGIDMLIGTIVLFPAGFIFSSEPRQLPPALQSWFFTPHVAAYMLSYIFMAKAAFQAVLQFFSKKPKTNENLPDRELAAYYLVCAGFPLMTLGLILGSCWGQRAWGHYWGWDPKELWSLASWLAYVAYFHFRALFGRKYPRINCLWIILGMVLILITLLWANLSRLFIGLHSYAT